MQIGVGMVSRGEVALIVAAKGQAVGLMNPTFFGPVVIMVVLTTIISPIFLKFAFKDKHKDYELVESELIDSYNQTRDIDCAEQNLLHFDKK